MITSAVKRGTVVYIYGEQGKLISSVGCPSDAQLLGFTSNTVTIKRGNMAYVYNEKGQLLYSTLA